MIIDTDDLLNSIKESFKNIKHVKSEEIPDIDLYMDQVTTFLDEKLKSSARNPKAEEKLVTKTMINNYAKTDVIPAPIRKKYSRDHIFLIIFVYYYKNFLQINDVKTLLDPIRENFLDAGGEFGIEDVYKEVFDNLEASFSKIEADVTKDYEEAMKSFEDAPKDMQEYLKLFNLISKISTDIYVKKLLVEKMIDSIKEHRTDSMKESEE
ncbi:MAG: DUF1836 domain-containing protein [Lachnospiraceae bacterium]|nr:DUF1836 domain-containing protein [Lachnospiraceae bacterium]